MVYDSVFCEFFSYVCGIKYPTISLVSQCDKVTEYCSTVNSESYTQSFSQNHFCANITVDRKNNPPLFCSFFSFRAAEAAFVKERDETTSGHNWEKICRLCEFNPKNSKNMKDISRLRSILLQLKQTPLER